MLAAMQVAFLHGLETGPHGTKYQALRRVIPDVVAPDCTGVFDIDERLRIIEAAVDDARPLVLVGSSFGGLAAVLFASRRPERVSGCVLCAPALHRVDLRRLAWVPAETVVIHGTRDEIVPLAASRALVARFPHVRLHAVDDEHGLGGHVALLVAEVSAMLRRLEAARR
jgi:pimeloyl-ACP methyl ester carboxylesterase